MFTSSLNLSLVALCASAMLILGILTRFVRPAWLGGRGPTRVAAFLFGGSATLIVAIELCGRISGVAQGPVVIPTEVLATAIAAATVCGLFLSIDTWLVANRPPAKQPMLWGVLALGVGLAGWSYHQLDVACAPRFLVSIDRIAQGHLAHVDEAFGETDLGRRIELLRFEDLANEYHETIELAPTHGGVARSRPSDRANCHGWVFTAGQHFVSGIMVDRILEDNGYERAANPEPGDLIVYRSDDGEVLHSGIVRGKLDDGLVIIESKFGIGARFLHLPEDQPYSQFFEYYRTSRGGHVIAIRNDATHGRPLAVANGRKA